MSGITSEFVKTIASIWHGFFLGNEEAKTLTNMLAPMDDAGEEVSSSIKFELETEKTFLPSLFNSFGIRMSAASCTTYTCRTAAIPSPTRLAGFGILCLCSFQHEHLLEHR